MLQHSFSDFSYAINTESKKKKHKEILVCYIYNGVEVLKKVYIPEKPGTAYVFEAKKIIDQEMRSGALSSYSHKFVKRKNKEAAKKKKKEEKAKAKAQSASANNNNNNKVSTKGKGNKKVVAIVSAVFAVVLIGAILGAFFATRGSAPNTAHISFAASSCQIDGPDTVKMGEKYECHIIPTVSSEKSTVEVSEVQMAGVKLKSPEDYTFDNTTNVLVINKVTGEIKITATAHEVITSYPVTFNGIGCDLTKDSPKIVEVGKEYECDIVAERTTEAPVISEITMSGVKLTEKVDYTFTNSKHLKVTKKANGSINIKAGVETVVFNVTCDYPSDIVFDGAETVNKGKTYSSTISCTDEKSMVNITSIRMAGKTLTEGSDWKYSQENNRLTIDKEANGNINIVVSKKAAKYDVVYHLSGCSLVEGKAPIIINAGEKLSCTFVEPETDRVNYVTGVSMGGVALKEGASEIEGDYHFINNTLSLHVAASGNIVVSAISYNPGADTYTANFDAGEGCVAIETMTGIVPMSSIECRLDVQDPSTKKVRIDAVAMGGVSLKENVDYSYDPELTAGNNFKIFKVSSNVLVKFVAVDIGDIVATPNYKLSEDGTSYYVEDFNLHGREASEIDSITIEGSYVPENSNADPLPVISIKEGALNKFSNLKELTIPFIGGKKIIEGKDPRDGTQLFGYIFGDTPYAGASATWQTYYDEKGKSIPKKYIIPLSLKTVNVTGDDLIIPAGAFSGCRSIDTVHFEQDKATAVKSLAFYGCVSLRNINIPNTVSIIEESAFQNCETLQHLNLPSNLITIASYAFMDCKSILKVYLGQTIEQVGTSVFTGIRAGVIACAKTKTQIENNEYWDKQWVDIGASVVYGATGIDDYIDKTNQFHYMIVKDDNGQTGVHIAEYLGDSTQTEITIPEKIIPQGGTEADSMPVFGLGDYMFSEYSLTTKFVLNCKQITSIGTYCFSYCSKLTTLEGFDQLTNLKEIGAYSFGACTSLASISIPSSVASIGEYAFAYDAFTTFDLSGCTNLKEIEEGLFYFCRSMETVTLPTGITYLGENIFEGCYALSTLTLDTTGIDTIPYALCYCAESTEYSPSLTSFTWSSSTPLASIGGSAFGGCTALTSVTLGSSTTNHLPTSVGTVGDYAFARCTSIPSFTIDKSNSGVSNISMGLEIFKNWSGSQVLYIDTGWVTGGGFLSTEATLAWGWKLSRPLLSGNFHCSKTGSDALVINRLE